MAKHRQISSRGRTTRRALAIAALAVIGLCAVLPTSSFGTPRRHHPGVVLTGPMTNLNVGTEYTYHVEVLSSKSYRQAYVVFHWADCDINDRANLVANRPWHGTFTVVFSSTQAMTEPLLVGVISAPTPKSFAKDLYGTRHAVTPAAVQVPPPTPPPVCPNPGFGS